MKKMFFAAAAAAMLTACSGNSGSGEAYTVTVPVADADGTMAYLMDFDTDAKIDSAMVKDTLITFSGQIDKAAMVRLIVNGGRSGMFILEPGTLTLDRQRNVSGSELNDRIEKFYDYASGLEDKIRSLAMDSTTDARIEEITKEYEATKAQFIRENADNVAGYYVFLQDAYSYSPEQLDSMLTVYPAFKDYKRIQTLVKAAAVKQATSPGHKFKDFAVEYNDSTYRLSDYVGKGRYTLVDFWASWCNPCIRETVVIKELYGKYHDAGLDVVGVAVWDEPENTLKAIEQHELPWSHIINAQKIPSDLYGFQGIPCIMLVDPNGVIVARDVFDDDLRRAVDAVFSPEKTSAPEGASE